jgi:hypothetical protein
LLFIFGMNRILFPSYSERRSLIVATNEGSPIYTSSLDVASKK